jgi:hypothetical protein
VPPRIILILVLCAVAGSSCSLAAASTTSSPSAAKIRADVARAERSSGLWATINICNTKAHPDTVGIRGQIPPLGFQNQMQMQIELEYYSVKTGAFEPLSAASASAGTSATRLTQEGVNFQVKPPAVLDGRITFSWTLNHKLLAKTTRTTRAGVTGVRDGKGASSSAAECRIGS